jgi:Tfp pilus assembly protein PilN
VDAARAILHAHGIPSADVVVSQEPRLLGSQILPLIQPVLQRYIVELRQSLRFGLGDQERAAITLTLAGPGSNLPGLAALFATELELSAAADAKYAGFDYHATAGAGSETIDALGEGSLLSELNLMPQAIATARRMAGLRRWLWTGAAAAALLVIADGMRYHVRLGHAREQMTALEAKTLSLDALDTTRDRVVAAATALAEVDRAINEEVGMRLDGRAILQELAALTPPAVQLTAVIMNRQKEGVVGHIEGFAAAMSDQPAQTQLQPYMDMLKQSALMKDVILRDVQNNVVSDGAGTQFAASFTPVLIPSIPDSAAVASAETSP